MLQLVLNCSWRFGNYREKSDFKKFNINNINNNYRDSLNLLRGFLKTETDSKGLVG